MFSGISVVLSPRCGGYRRSLEENGAKVTLTSKASYMLVKPDDAQAFSAKEARRKGLSTVSSAWIDDCLKQMERLSMDEYLLEENDAKRSKSSPFTPYSFSRPVEEAIDFKAFSFDLGPAEEEEEVVEVVKKVELTFEERRDQMRLEDQALPTLNRKWQTARVFISSTFKDMHGERDFLTRYVFPELQDKCNKLCIHISPVDLRWGVTADETSNALEICLGEVESCRPFFLGILGERYGWVPDSYASLPDEERFDWVQFMPPGLSVTALEMHSGIIRDPESVRGGVFLRKDSFMRDVPYDLLPDFAAENDSSAQKMADLKAEISNTCATVVEYDCVWKGVVDGKPMVGSLEEFGATVLEVLWKAIKEEFGTECEGDASPLAADRTYHDAFVENNSRNFVGRTELLDSLFSYVEDSSCSPLVVSGEPGSGKTSLVATFVRKLCERETGGTDSPVVAYHFVGAAPGSTTIRNTVRRMVDEMHEALGVESEAEGPETFSDIRKLFTALLEEGKEPSEQRRVVVIIDAVNQLDNSDNAIALDWLPLVLGPHAKLIVSCLPGQWLLALKAKGLTELHVGPLVIADRVAIVTQTLAEYRKKVSSSQMDVLLAKADAVKPLYLKVACEELRVSGVFEELTARIESLPDCVPELFDEVLARLEGDHGMELVRAVLGLMDLSRAGVTESELLSVLNFLGEDYGADKGSETFPRSVWARLYRSIAVYLRPRGDDGGGVLDFFHRQLAKAVRRRYLDESTGIGGAEEFRYDINARLAACFLARADPLRDGSWSGQYPRGVSELPYHLLLGRQWKQLEAVLCDVVFIEAKCAFGQGYDLVADYLTVAAEVERQRQSPDEAPDPTRPWLPPKKMSAQAARHIADFRRFILARVHHLHRRPALTFVAAVNQPDASPVAIGALRRWNLGLESRPHFSWRNKPQEAESCIMTMAGHEMVVRACKYSASGTRVVSACDDKTLKIWNADTGGELQTLKGHSASVQCVDWSSDERYIASGCWNKTVKVWSLDRGELLSIPDHSGVVFSVKFLERDGVLLLCTASRDRTIMVFEIFPEEGRYTLSTVLGGHTDAVNGIAVTDAHLVSCSADRTVRVWSMVTYGCVGVINDHRKAVNKVSFSPDGMHFVTCSDDRTARVYSIETRQNIHVLEGHKDGIASVAYSQDGKRIATVSHDNLVMVFDAHTGGEIGMLAGHTGSVFDVCWSPDSSRVVTSSFDRSLKVWDMTGSLRLIMGHSARILDVAYSLDGRLVVTASRDKTLKVWDASTAEELFHLVGHTSNVFGCALSPDSTLVASASRDKTLKLWDTKTGACTKTLQGHNGIVYCVDFSPDGHTIVTGSEDKLIKLWDTATGTEKGTLYGHRSQVRCVSYSPDGNKIVSGSDDLTLKLWCARRRRKLATFCGHTRPVVACAFSPDSTKVLSGGDDRIAIEWSAVNAKKLAVITGHSAAVVGVGYAPNGEYFLTGSTDSLVIAWDADTREEITSFATLSRVCSLNVSRSLDDMGTFAVGDGSGALYYITPQGWSH